MLMPQASKQILGINEVCSLAAFTTCYLYTSTEREMERDREKDREREKDGGGSRRSHL